MTQLNLLRQKSAPPTVTLAVDQRPLEQIIREGRLLIGPALAERILTDAHYEGQRPVVAHHVTLLAEDMRRDRWTPGSQLCFGRLKGRLYLINGRHRMSGVVQSGSTVQFQILVIDVDSEDELASLYYRFDRRQRARSDSEVLNALKIAEEHKLSKGMTKAIWDASLLIANRFQRPNYQADPVGVRSDDARLATASAWWAIGADFEGFLSDAPPHVFTKLKNAQIVAVGLVTTKFQPLNAKEFWTGLAANDGLRRGDPRNTLLSDLATRPMIGGRLSGAIAASSAWNAFCERRKIMHIKVLETSMVRLIGTPFDGRRA